jgi:hypothetical protein
MLASTIDKGPLGEFLFLVECPPNVGPGAIKLPPESLDKGVLSVVFVGVIPLFSASNRPVLLRRWTSLDDEFFFLNFPVPGQQKNLERLLDEHRHHCYQYL